MNELILTEDEIMLVDAYRTLSTGDKKSMLLMLSRKKMMSDEQINVLNCIGDNNTITVDGDIYVNKPGADDDE